MIIDAHMHIYDPTRPQGVPWPPEKDDFLYRAVLPEHCKAAAEPEGVSGMVVVEASEWVEDNAWVLKLAENEPFIVGFVGNLDPSAPDFAANLDRFAESPLFRGIRMRGQVVDHLNCGYMTVGLKRMADRDLALDLLARPQHLAAVAGLAEAVPGLRVVINHVGGVFIDGNAPDPEWVDGIQAAAAHPTVYCKVSGMGSHSRQVPAPTDAAFYAPTMDALWEAFGEDRLIYGSDWPVSARALDYADVTRIVRKHFEAKGAAAVEKYFRSNSKAAYKWLER